MKILVEKDIALHASMMPEIHAITEKFIRIPNQGYFTDTQEHADQIKQVIENHPQAAIDDYIEAEVGKRLLRLFHDDEQTQVIISLLVAELDKIAAVIPQYTSPTLAGLEADSMPVLKNIRGRRND